MRSLDAVAAGPTRLGAGAPQFCSQPPSMVTTSLGYQLVAEASRILENSSPNHAQSTPVKVHVDGLGWPEDQTAREPLDGCAAADSKNGPEEQAGRQAEQQQAFVALHHPSPVSTNSSPLIAVQEEDGPSSSTSRPPGTVSRATSCPIIAGSDAASPSSNRRQAGLRQQLELLGAKLAAETEARRSLQRQLAHVCQEAGGAQHQVPRGLGCVGGDRMAMVHDTSTVVGCRCARTMRPS